MGLLGKLRALGRPRRGRKATSARQPLLRARQCRFEEMESRQLLSVAPVQVGVVYYEDASGFDEAGGDRFEVTFQGGVPGTQLTSLVIETDKLGDGLTIGDCLFDTASGGTGAYQAIPLAIVGREGIDDVQFSVADGGTTLLFTFRGFDPGEKLVFTVDVDEMGFLGPNAVAEGNELEGSQLHATFAAPHFYEATGNDMFIDKYDAKLAASGLPLPPDDYMPPASTPQPVLTAGAFFPLDTNAAADHHLPAPCTRISTSTTRATRRKRESATSPSNCGNGRTEPIRPPARRSRPPPTARTSLRAFCPAPIASSRRQPNGYFSVGAAPAQVAGRFRGVVTSSDVLSEIALVGGDDSVHNDFAEARPAALSGHVYHDADNDGRFDPGETGIAGRAYACSICRPPALLRPQSRSSRPPTVPGVSSTSCPATTA